MIQILGCFVISIYRVLGFLLRLHVLCLRFNILILVLLSVSSLETVTLIYTLIAVLTEMLITSGTVVTLSLRPLY